MSLPGYDAWKLATPDYYERDEEEPERDEEEESEPVEDEPEEEAPWPSSDA